MQRSLDFFSLMYQWRDIGHMRNHGFLTRAAKYRFTDGMDFRNEPLVVARRILVNQIRYTVGLKTLYSDLRRTVLKLSTVLLSTVFTLPNSRWALERVRASQKHIFLLLQESILRTTLWSFPEKPSLSYNII